MAPALRLLALVCTASALVVRDGGELKAALANGAPAIEDLIAAVEQTIDGEGATAAASNPLRGASFAPGTHAQRHRVRQSGSKHGGARRVFSRPLTPLVTKFRGSSSSAD